MEEIMMKAPVQLITLTEDRLEELIKAAGEAGANAAMMIAERERMVQHKKIVDKRLHNTKLLLEHYHVLKLNMQRSVCKRSQMRESAADILNGIMYQNDDDVIIESINRSVGRTAIILEHIDIMLGLYEAYCKKSGKIDRRRYDVIFDRYISGKMLSVKEISLKISQSERTVYEDINVATMRLTALIFGVDGLKFK